MEDEIDPEEAAEEKAEEDEAAKLKWETLEQETAEYQKQEMEVECKGPGTDLDAAFRESIAPRNSSERQALIEMAKGDFRRGITPEDMEAYKDLNRGLPDPLPEEKVRGPEEHDSGLPSSRAPHGHVGPVDHIPILDPKP